MIAYRTMNSGDIPSGLSLCRHFGWNQLARDWELFLQVSPQGCRVAVDESGNVVGTATTVRYENHFSWIGMVLVDPGRQRQGIGRQLMNESLHVLESEKTIKLDATPAGREVYKTLGFADEYSLSRMHCESPVLRRLQTSGARSLRPAELRQLADIDRTVFGADRTIMLKWMLEGASSLAWVTEEADRLTGFCFGRIGHRFTHIGPVIAPDVHRAIELISAALTHCTGAVILDVPARARELLTWLASIGFAEQRPLIRMYRGTNDWPGVPEKQWAILGPEFG